MPAPARPAPSPVVLLVYPVTLLLGSLFSVISPVARSTRSSSHDPAAPLAPSLAADLHLSESPVNYFARKSNIFNLYFVKVGWIWLTVAFASLVLFQPAYNLSSASHAQQEIRFRRSIQAFLRWCLATIVWYLTTQWFFGPAIIDRSFMITGGKCGQALDLVAKANSESSSVQLETVFTAAACKAAGGAWKGGHDISGHVFMLVLVTALLVFEAVGAGAVAASPSAAPESAGRERKASDPNALPNGDQDASFGTGRTWSMRLVWGVVVLGWWMLFMTAIWFHTWLEKWSGLAIALSTIYVIYILPRRLPPWKDIVGLPGV
ncbi:Fat storage-inducing transmembrane protein [Penicillium atrosanguineum]|uniref:Acyl-coenzyme A diphosphatase SCS3 n=1 Tax=Penicillium atrosanguineum TaxID=1132637 RepID=A0A9W9H716_9EURO|nr:Fat storage-inducing transmembrane protein [Penicillium atrosanguineum]KAJ5139835.1 Fat storage-inducing transmembrane protein [Penicillium atrosanguineum]KAJ5315275.1 Fat storage-inducing transmembrane protein [Penicillium atrosanguineum]